MNSAPLVPVPLFGTVTVIASVAPIGSVQFADVMSTFQPPAGGVGVAAKCGAAKPAAACTVVSVIEIVPVGHGTTWTPAWSGWQVGT